MTPRSSPSGNRPRDPGPPASNRGLLPLARASGFLLWALTLVVMGVVLWRDPRPVTPATVSRLPRTLEPAERTQARSEPLVPIPHPFALDEGEVRLGRRLFHDPRLSASRDLSCASCHRSELGGADGRRRSVGDSGRELGLHTPSAFNAVHDTWRADGPAVSSLEEHLDRHVADPDVFGSSWTRIAQVLGEDPGLATAFRSVYPEGLGPGTARRALTAYQRALVTPDGTFDRWLRGHIVALDPDVAEGYRLFKEVGCAACHQGVNVGGNMLQAVGRLGPGGRGSAPGETPVRRRKVPGLRNVALTAPYFHDGSAETLSAAVARMARQQVGLELDADEVAAIVRFLESLTGELPEIAR